MREIIYKNIKRSYINIGKSFNQQFLLFEIERLSNLYKKKINYNFNSLDNILFKINTDIKNNFLNIIINLYKKQNIIQDSLLQPKYYYQNISIQFTTCKNLFIDKLYNGSKIFSCPINKNYDLKRIIDAMMIKPRKIFFNKDILLTKRNFFYLKNYFIQELSMKEGLRYPMQNIADLNVNILLIPLKKYEIKLYYEIIYSKINNIKINSGINFIIRNLLQTGEILKIKLQKNFYLNTILKYWISKLETNLYIPNFFFPFKKSFIKKSYPRLNINILFNINNSKQIINNHNIIYYWNTSYYSTHKINILKNNIQKLFNSILLCSPIIHFYKKEYYNMIINYKKQKLHNPLYHISYLYNYNEIINKTNKQPRFFSTKIELSGIVFFLLKKYLFQDFINDFKIQIELKKYWIRTNNKLLLSQFLFLIGIYDYSYITLKLNKKYIYNNYDVRVWNRDNLKINNIKNKLIHYLSNIKIINNIEYRYQMINNTYIIFFINTIYLLQSNFYNQIFNINHFYKKLLIYYGIGLRYDFKYIIARIDFTHKIIDSTKKFWNLSISQNNIINFAIGYPF